MAAIVVRHATCRNKQISLNFCKKIRCQFSSSIQQSPSSEKSSAVAEDALPKHKKLQDFKLSLSSRGFLRYQKPYEPPADVQEKLEKIAKSIYKTNLQWHTKLDNPQLKFNILNTCFKEFNHSVPNSMLYLIETLDDVLEFYSTAVDVRTPLEAMKNMDLPDNLHVQYEYLRFHPDTDTKFGGISAFPKSSTIVTGLKYKKKYQGHEAKKQWP